ncbi:hypothetical protein Q428_12910 [Fervidicella metallireducens AeB]|uniref:BON domain-containing protein n=1 Tax=Fervidicella metallireducens AeB TaxID=1403537 RepID=A0A017RSD6_9CLOT|nr:BON domain-containing protein [Fervidicella metallireducens]EYE87501.1 hypothetical protein Q428_12910 [Fervidicella metallireducens AeB]
MEQNYDKIIEHNIKAYLDQEMRESELNIQVRSKDGYVTLSGFVDVLAEKNAAEELAFRVEGVKKIENCLTISTDGTFTDKEAEAEVISKFKGNPELTPVSVKVNRGVAVLEGRVPTLRVKNLAIHQASKALGVKDVVSHITIDSLNKIDDVTINNNLYQKFSQHNMKDSDIVVDVNNGSVLLSGYVDSMHQMEAALEIAEGVEGVRNVKNNLEIRIE